jgi:hypothetical protein
MARYYLKLIVDTQGVCMLVLLAMLSYNGGTEDHIIVCSTLIVFLQNKLC